MAEAAGVVCCSSKRRNCISLWQYPVLCSSILIPNPRCHNAPRIWSRQAAEPLCLGLSLNLLICGNTRFQDIEPCSRWKACVASPVEKSRSLPKSAYKTGKIACTNQQISYSYTNQQSGLPRESNPDGNSNSCNLILQQNYLTECPAMMWSGWRQQQPLLWGM